MTFQDRFRGKIAHMPKEGIQGVITDKDTKPTQIITNIGKPQPHSTLFPRFLLTLHFLRLQDYY